MRKGDDAADGGADGVNHEDLTLVRRMLAGEEKAFEAFFEASFPGLYRFALRRLDHREDAAEEVAQAALCKAIDKLETYRGEAALFTWLCTFCRYEILAWYKKKKRTARRVRLIQDSPEVRAAFESSHTLASSPEQSLGRAEIGRLVHAVLDELPPHYGSSLEWKYIEGLPVKEIANRLEVSAKAAESLLTRARDAFREGFNAMVRASGPQGSSSGPMESSS